MPVRVDFFCKLIINSTVHTYFRKLLNVNKNCTTIILVQQDHKLSNMHMCHGRDRMIVGFTTTCAISAYHHNCYEFEPRSWQGVLDTTFCDQVCQ